MFPAETRILIADDSQTTRALIRSFLKNSGLGWHLNEAENGVRALEVLKDQQEKNKPIQLILSDWEMPVLTGLDFLKKVRSDERYKSVPFIMVTAVNKPEQVIEAVKSGVTAYIVKPVLPEALQAKLKQAWDKTQTKKV